MPSTPNLPVEIVNRGGLGDCVFVCEHASNQVPEEWGDLGLGAQHAAHVLASHAAWDPGAKALAVQLAMAFDAPLVSGTVSRLVYDCNRPPESATAVLATSERFDIPGNRDLDAEQRERRVRSVYRPFEAALVRLLDERDTARGVPSVLVTIHSFTPVYNGEQRQVQLGVLHDQDSRLADVLLQLAPEFTELDTQRNQPYAASDGVTHTLKRHALPRGYRNVMLEVRNDLLRDDASVKRVAEPLSRWLSAAIELSDGARTTAAAARCDDASPPGPNDTRSAKQGAS